MRGVKDMKKSKQRRKKNANSFIKTDQENLKS